MSTDFEEIFKQLKGQVSPQVKQGLIPYESLIFHFPTSRTSVAEELSKSLIVFGSRSFENDTANSEQEIDSLLMQTQHIHEQINRERDELLMLQAETRAILDDVMNTLKRS